MLLLLLISLFINSPDVNSYILKGYVYSRGVVEDEDGKPYFAEYNAQTGHLEGHFKATGSFATENVTIMSASQYRRHVKRFEEIQQQFADAWAIANPDSNGQAPSPINISREALLDTEFQVFTGVGNEAALTFRFHDNDLQANARHFILRPPIHADVDTEGYQYYSISSGGIDIGSTKQYILMAQMPINPEEAIPGNSLSLLVSKALAFEAKRVLKTSEHNLAMLTGFVDGVAGAEKYDGDNYLRTQSEIKFDNKDNFTHPIRGVFVETGSMLGTEHAVTDEKGFYLYSFRSWQRSPCLIYVQQNTHLTFKLWTLSFNPRLKRGYPYWVSLPHSIPCDPLHPVDLSIVGGHSYSLTGQAGYLAYMQVVGGMSTPVDRRDYLVDMKILAGQAQISNEQWSLDATAADSPVIYYGKAMNPSVQYTWAPPGWQKQIEVVEGGKTTYAVNDPDDHDHKLAQHHYDFDGDGIGDIATIGQFTCSPAGGGEDYPVSYEEHCDSGDSRYFKPDPEATAQGKISKSRLDSAEKPYYQGIIFSSRAGKAVTKPDLIRLLDDAINDYHQGLVEVISRQDLRNTDIYVFRESTGDLLTERNGLSPSELRADIEESDDFDVTDGNFHYRLQLRGALEGSHRIGKFNQYDENNKLAGYYKAFETWQTTSGMNPKFHQREADHIRPGEPVRIVIINRATGYTGSARTVLTIKDSRTSLPSIEVPDIRLGPPNLKIWAEREFTVTSGLTRGEKKQAMIGSEGGAGAEDLIIKVYTEWLDQDGSPLPEQLSDFGYTARIGTLTGVNVISDINSRTESGQSVRYFPIKPGKHLQLIRVSEVGTGTQHLYVQVNGESYIRNPDFSGDPAINIAVNRKTGGSGVDFDTLGAGPAQLISRPQRYVPVLTPVWDENTTLENALYYQQWKNQVSGNGEETDSANPLKPEAHYKWRYRPEFQFSVYAITPRDILVQRESGSESDATSESLIQSTTPVIDSGVDLLQFVYDLGEAVAEPLAMFSTDEKELVLAVGEEEVKLHYGRNNEVTISNLAHLANLEAEDFLTARIYLNNDASNLLWEWAQFSPDISVVPRSLVQGYGIGKRTVDSDIVDTYFFPALGNKKIFVKNNFSSNYPGKVAIISVEGDAFETVPAIGTYVDISEKVTKFLLKGGQSVIPKINDPNKEYKVKFRILLENYDPIDKEIAITIKTNSNTPLIELLEGKAVWFKGALDSQSTADQKLAHKGQTIGGDPSNQYVDYGQYIMNMIAIPLIAEVKESNLKYAIQPDGDFGPVSEKMLKSFMKIDSQEGDIPSFENETYAHDSVVSHFDTDTGIVTSNTRFRSLRKLLQDYQPVTDLTVDNVVVEEDISTVTSLSFEDYRYKVMTPEVMRGVENNSQEGRTIAVDGVFTDNDLGLYELYLSYDWDGDGLSNLAEVENSTQYSVIGVMDAENSRDLFDPLNAVDVRNAYKTTYSRGYVALGGTPVAPTSRGLGELSGLDGSSLPGLRIPTFAPGLYDFPAGDSTNVDSYSSARVLNILEAAGRRWARTHPDVAPLETNPLTHNRTNSGPRIGNMRFGINDISGKGGGVNANCANWPLRYSRTISCTTLGHTSHQSGLDMDIRYVSNNNMEAALLVNGAVDIASTIDLVNLITNNGTDLDLIIVGSSIAANDLNDFRAEYGSARIISNSAHDNHIHLRLTKEDISLPSGQVVVQNVGHLDYVPNDVDASMNIVEFTVRDAIGNALLPWTSLNFATQNTAIANSNGHNLVINNGNITEYDPNNIWINISNTEGNAGRGALEIECRGVGETEVLLTDERGNAVGSVPVNCVQQGSGTGD